MINLRRLLRLTRPVQLLLAALTYALGTGVLHYLGHSINALVFILGLVAILSIQIASSWLLEQFHLPSLPLQMGETIRDRENFRVALLEAAYAALTLAGAIIISLLVAGKLNLASLVVFIVIVLVLMALALPPFRLAEAGYGELVLAVYMGTLLPALSFLMQFRDLHRLLTFTTFPLTLLGLAYFLIADFPAYATDLKEGRNSLLTRLTWQRAIPIHHILLLIAFLFFAGSPFFGFPWGLIWPVFVVLPFAAIQILWLQRISLGGPTLWNFLTNLALATFALTAYLLAFSFWIH